MTVLYRSRSRKNLAKSLVAVSVLALGLFALVSVWARLGSDETTPTTVRVTLVTEGMFFVQEEVTNGRNPTLYVPPGKPVILRLENRDAGTRHQLTVAKAEAATPVIDAGKAAEVRLPPMSAGEVLKYICSLHPITMQGKIVVGEPDAASGR